MSAPERRYVDELPDLIDASEYAEHPTGALVRVRISVDSDGVQLLGDALRPAHIEALLEALGDGPIERMLCG
jgi:hypothetical protein